jgi:hypothetical protein
MNNIKRYVDSFHGQIYGYCHQHGLTLHIIGIVAVLLFAMAAFYIQKNRRIKVMVDIAFAVLSAVVIFFFFYNRAAWGETTSLYALRAFIPLALMGYLTYRVRRSNTLTKTARGIAVAVFVIAAWYLLESFLFVDVFPVNVLINWGSQ